MELLDIVDENAMIQLNDEDDEAEYGEEERKKGKWGGPMRSLPTFYVLMHPPSAVASR